VEQTCVVSLDPVENDVEELIDVTFAPPDQISAMPKSVQKEQGDDAEIPDLPEPIVNGAIDLGKLATEFLVLGIDPYPRKPGAAFAAPETPPDPDEHPFAALRALKEAPGGSKGKNPRKMTRLQRRLTEALAWVKPLYRTIKTLLSLPAGVVFSVADFRPPPSDTMASSSRPVSSRLQRSGFRNAYAAKGSDRA
jgi:hypothetical protein